MACISCGNDRCNCPVKVISKQGLKGKDGKPGPAGPSNFIVTDGSTSIVNNVSKIQFTDINAIITSPSAGIANVNFGAGAATAWNDLLNIPWYVTGSSTIKPQYTIDGNRITLRGLLYIPLVGVNIANANSYLFTNNSVLDESRLSVISNANNNNGTPQGRFMTTDVSASKNFPTAAIPIGRDIVFNDVLATRRYTGGGFVSNYRSRVQLRIGSTLTAYKNNANVLGSGCLMVFSPWNEEYDGTGTPPLGNDPTAFLVSRVTSGNTANDYVTATDDNPFSVPAAAGTNPFSFNGHQITSLGGVLINLEGLTGFLN